MIIQTPIVSRWKTKWYKNQKKTQNPKTLNNTILNSVINTYQVLMMIRCSFCVFLVSLLLYYSIYCIRPVSAQNTSWVVITEHWCIMSRLQIHYCRLNKYYLNVWRDCFCKNNVGLMQNQGLRIAKYVLPFIIKFQTLRKWSYAHFAVCLRNYSKSVWIGTYNLFSQFAKFKVLQPG